MKRKYNIICDLRFAICDFGATIGNRQSKIGLRDSLLTIATVLCVLIDFGSIGACEVLRHSPSQPQTGRQEALLELIAVPEEEKWLALVAAPIAARIKDEQKMPVVIVLSAERLEEQRQLLNRLQLLSNSCSVLSQDKNRGLFEAQDELPARVQTVRPSLAQASIQFAKSFFKRADTVVVASTSEPQMCILASVLAAHLRAPFIPCEKTGDLRGLARALDSLGANTILFGIPSGSEPETMEDGRRTTDERRATSNEHRVSRIENRDQALSSLRQKVEFLDGLSINQRIIQLLGKDRIRNIILARVPDSVTGAGKQSWIGPYLSVMRGAPVVLCSSGDGTAAEKQVEDFINRHSLRPRTVTILADYDSIGTINISDSKYLGDYEVPVEPCSRPLQHTAAAMGVGRIPCSELSASSAIVACGVARELMLGQNEPRVVMVANPNTEYSSLPFAETISRATAEEFKNCGLTVNEFYRMRTNDPSIIEASEQAHIIIYEGHLADQLLFQDPCSIFEYEQELPEDEQYESADDDPSTFPSEYEAGFFEPVGAGPGRRDYSSADLTPDTRPYYEHDWEAPHSPSGPDLDGFPEEFQATREESLPTAKIERLNGMPLVILQSCHSLEEAVTRQVFKLGGVGVIGSITNVYSASGSAFIKAFCDGLVYRGDTVGEALRDARNYFLCLRALKEQRGHQETAKVYRAALSFCLWGDPELRFIRELPKPHRKPISAVFVGADTVRVSTPRFKLPESRTEKYFLRMFPAGQGAGIVKRLKNEQTRRLMPIYFFRLPLPEQFDIPSGPDLDGRPAPDRRKGIHTLSREGENEHRAVFLADPWGRYIYVLYFPEKETKGEVFDLRFTFNSNDRIKSETEDEFQARRGGQD